MAKPGGLVCYRNFCDDPETIITVTSGDTGSILAPLSLMQARPLSERCVIQDLVLAIDIDFQDVRKIDFMAVMGINFRIGGPSNFSYSYKTNPGDDYSAPISEVVIDEMRQYSEVPMIGCVPEESFTCRFLRLEIYWAMDSFAVQCGRLWAGDAIVFPDGLQDNWNHGGYDSGTIDSSVGSHWFENSNTKSDRFNIGSGIMNTMQTYGFDDTAVDTAENVSSIQGMIRAIGATGEVIVVPRADVPIWVRRTAQYGHFAQVPSITKLGGPQYSTNFDVVAES